MKALDFVLPYGQNGEGGFDLDLEVILFSRIPFQLED